MISESLLLSFSLTPKLLSIISISDVEYKVSDGCDGKMSDVVWVI